MGKKMEYEKPVVERVERMDFPMEILVKGGRIVCRQCSDCHGCR